VSAAATGIAFVGTATGGTSGAVFLLRERRDVPACDACIMISSSGVTRTDPGLLALVQSRLRAGPRHTLTSINVTGSSSAAMRAIAMQHAGGTILAGVA
jgi:hypothetical protein